MDKKNIKKARRAKASKQRHIDKENQRDPIAEMGKMLDDMLASDIAFLKKRQKKRKNIKGKRS